MKDKLFGHLGLLVAWGLVAALCGCSALEPEIPDDDAKINLIYRPKRYRSGRLYNSKIMFTRFRDFRALKFYDGEDDYFKQKPEYGLAFELYNELKADNIFKKVDFVNIAPPAKIDDRFLKKMLKDYDSQFVFVGDIYRLNMERMKQGTNRLNNAKIVLRIGINAQIIHTPTGMVIWMEKLSAQKIVSAHSGRLSDRNLRYYFRQLQKEIGRDMRKMIKATSMRMN